MSMSDPRELEWAKKPDALKEGWKTRVGTHMVHGPLCANGHSKDLKSCQNKWAAVCISKSPISSIIED